MTAVLKKRLRPFGKRRGLSLRQETIARLYAEELTTLEIAYQLGISPKTVEYHRAKVYQKLKINNLVALTKFAIREGLATA